MQQEIITYIIIMVLGTICWFINNRVTNLSRQVDQLENFVKGGKQ